MSLIGKWHTVDVLTEDSRGEYTVVDREGLVCRVANVGFQPGRTTFERAELAAERLLLWDDAYEIPQHAQVQHGDVRYNVEAGTDNAWIGISGGVHHRSVLLTRVQDV